LKKSYKTVENRRKIVENCRKLKETVGKLWKIDVSTYALQFDVFIVQNCYYIYEFFSFVIIALCVNL